MTHWVIRIHQDQLFAGADRLASGPDYPSELSGTGTMPNIHKMTTVNKLAVYLASDNKQCIICCAGKTYPQHRQSGKSKNIKDILEQDILQRAFKKVNNTALELMAEVSSLLQNDYSIDSDQNSVMLGCGFSNTADYTGNQLTIAWYDSRDAVMVKACTTGYLNMRAAQLAPGNFQTDGTMTGENPAAFRIRKEIYDEHTARQDRVGNDSDIEYIAPLPAKNTYSSATKDMIRSSAKQSESTVNNGNAPLNKKSKSSCMIL